MMVAVKVSATARVTAAQPARGGRWSGKRRKRRPKKRSMARRLANSAAVQVGARRDRSLVRLGLKAVTRFPERRALKPNGMGAGAITAPDNVTNDVGCGRPIPNRQVTTKGAFP